MDATTENIKRQIIQVINKILFSEKKRVFKCGEASLHPSEVHLLLMIENDLATNASKIAQQLGLTKGAVSQTLSRLEKKGVIVKSRDPYNKNELTLSLTDLGKEAYQCCQSTKMAFIEAQDQVLAKLNPNEKEAVLSF